MSRTIQIREVDERTYTRLRTRAAAEHLSLTAYLRRELAALANRGPSMAELLDRADQRRTLGDHVNGADVVAAVRELRENDE